MLDKQIQILSCDTGNFYSKEESDLHWKILELRAEKKRLSEECLFGESKGLKGIVSDLNMYGVQDSDLNSVYKDKYDFSVHGNDSLKVELLAEQYRRAKDLISEKNAEIKETKDELLKMLADKVEANIVSGGTHHIRELNEESITKNNIISVFDSYFTRTIGAKPDEFCEDFMVVQVYYFDVIKDLIYNGFTYKGEKYIYFTSSAGQIRTKKTVFVKESVWKKYEKSIMCGLTIEDINARGGNNPNKHLAYLALANSATDVWEEFDIDKTIVIDDFETDVHGTYDLVDDVTYSIERTEGDVPVPHTDGAGMMLPCMGKNRMVRLPWVKGLLGVFDFVKFIECNNCPTTIKDIYGKEHDIIEEDIQIIFTKSQFKMWKYYDSWDDYKEKYKKYGCAAGCTNVEEDRIKDATINYQMLQTLTDIEDDEILEIAKNSTSKLNKLFDPLNEKKVEEFAKNFVDKLEFPIDYEFDKKSFSNELNKINYPFKDGKVAVTVNTLNEINKEEIKESDKRKKFKKAIIEQLKDDTIIKQLKKEAIDNIKDVFGVTPYNMNKTAFQKAIDLYPDLINDDYTKEHLRTIKNSIVKRCRAGKLNVNGKYTFILPDFYAACQYWFLGIKNPKGLLEDGEVFCWLFRKNDKLDCLRSPHLYREHAVRKNIACRDYEERQLKLREWYTTDAIYTSCHDLISKILQFDVDGDKALVVADKTIVKVAERNMIGIVPLYYNMKKAEPVQLNNETIYNGLNAAFTGGNIGIYSNNISKIWNSDIFVNGSEEEKNRAIDIVKLLCMENNFVIDYAKTLYKPQRPSDIHKEIVAYTKENLPHFFTYAKDKDNGQVVQTNGSFVNKLETIIKSPRINCSKLGLKKIDYRLMMSNPDIDVRANVVRGKIIKEETDPLIVKFCELSKQYRFVLDASLCVDKNTTSDIMKKVKYGQDYKHKVACEDIKKELSKFGYTDVEISDMLVKFMYNMRNTTRKAILWMCYGDIIYENLENKIRSNVNVIECKDCGKWFEVSKFNSKSDKCPECYMEYRRRNKTETMRKSRKG